MVLTLSFAYVGCYYLATVPICISVYFNKYASHFVICYLYPTPFSYPREHWRSWIHLYSVRNCLCSFLCPTLRPEQKQMWRTIWYTHPSRLYVNVFFSQNWSALAQKNRYIWLLLWFPFLNLIRKQIFELNSQHWKIEMG